MAIRMPLCTDAFPPLAEKVNVSLPSPEKVRPGSLQTAFPSEVLFPCREHHKATLARLYKQCERILARHILEMNCHDHSAANRLRILETRHELERASTHHDIDIE